MKKTIALLIILAAVLTLFGCGSKETPGGEAPEETKSVSNGEYTLEQMEGRYKTQGRTILYDEGLAMLSSADSFEFNADCSGKASVKMLAKKSSTGSDVDVYFTGYVDGERCDERYHLDGEGESEFVLAGDLADGDHNFRLVRQTEWDNGDIYVTGIAVNGELTEKPADGKLLIEFVGDSLTTGFGNLSDIPDDQGSWEGAPIFQDETQAFPFKTCEAMDADISVVAIQGIGCACGYQPFTMNEIYMNYPRVDEKDYTFKPERQADIVVIDLLSNDIETRKDNGVGMKDLVDKSVELVKMIREVYPEAKIVFAPAAMENRIEAAMQELGGEEAGYYYTTIPMDFNGKGGHPSLEGHQTATDSLVAALTGIIGE